MAKKAYIGVSNVAKKVKKMYIGVGGVAKKVKKGYVGVNGIARLFFTGTLKLVYHQGYYATGAYANTAGAYNGKYGFIGGSDQNAHTNDVAAIDKDLVRTTPASATYRPSQGTQINPYVIFMPYEFSGFDYYNQAQTHGTFTIANMNTNYGFHALHNDEYAVLFPGNVGYGYPNVLYLIDDTLTAVPVDVSQFEYKHNGNPCCTDHGDYAIISGGEDSAFGEESNTNFFHQSIEAVDTQGTIISLSNLPECRSRAIGVRAGDYALCAGGETGDNGSVCGETYTVYAFNQSLTRSNAPNLSLHANPFIWSNKAAASAGEYGVVAIYNQTYYSGKYTFTYKYDAYSGDLVKQTFDTDKIRHAAVSVGTGAVFSSNAASNRWDAFSLE